MAALLGRESRSDGVQARSSNAGPTRTTNADDLRQLGSPMASSWRRNRSIDFCSCGFSRSRLWLQFDDKDGCDHSGLVCDFNSRRCVDLLSYNLSCSVPHGSFRGAKIHAIRARHCKIVVRINQSAPTRPSCRANSCCDCLQAAGWERCSKL